MGKRLWNLSESSAPSWPFSTSICQSWDGLKVAKEIARLKLETKVIFLSFHKNEDIFRAALAAGGRGYLLKDQRNAGDRSCCTSCGRRQSVHEFSNRSSTAGWQRFNKYGARRSANSRSDCLERRILKLIAEGLSSKEIGQCPLHSLPHSRKLIAQTSVANSTSKERMPCFVSPFNIKKFLK